MIECLHEIYVTCCMQYIILSRRLQRLGIRIPSFLSIFYYIFYTFNQKKEYNQSVITNLAEIKGCFLACGLICNIPVDVGTLVDEDVSLMLQVERCISNKFEVIRQSSLCVNVCFFLPLSREIYQKQNA